MQPNTSLERLLDDYEYRTPSRLSHAPTGILAANPKAYALRQETVVKSGFRFFCAFCEQYTE